MKATEVIGSLERTAILRGLTNSKPPDEQLMIQAATVRELLDAAAAHALLARVAPLIDLPEDESEIDAVIGKLGEVLYG